MKTTVLHALACFAMLAAMGPPVRADVVETKTGARLVGKITKIDGTAITLETDYAGMLVVKQCEVSGVKTDAPLFVRLAAGTVVQGTLAPVASGKVEISGPGGALTAPVDKITAMWAPGGKDPALVALERKWSYEAAVDVNGASGNREQLGTAASVRAKLAGPTDTLQLYSAYNRQATNGATSADQFKAGIDYADNFSGRYSWYVRDEGGFDRVKDINLYNVAASGFGYDLIQKPKHVLTGRTGLSFRYEDYRNPATEDVRALGLDFGLNHTYTFSSSKLVNQLSYTPSVEDFTNFHLNQESYYEIPLVHSRWKLRLGISHDYSSKPGANVNRLDTTFFTRMVLNWQ